MNYRYLGGILVVVAIALFMTGCMQAIRDPGDSLLEPMPDAETLRQLALKKAGLPADFEGDIPPSDHWTSTAKFPPSQPQGTLAANQNIRVNQDISGRDQNETVFAVSPIDVDNLVGGASLFGGMETLFGPLYLAYGHSTLGGDTVHLLLGRAF